MWSPGKSCFLVFVLGVQGLAGEGCRREVRSLGESDLVITEEVERGGEFEVDVETDLGDDGQHAVVIRSELLGPGPGEEEETSPLFFNVAQAGMMKGWQISYRSQYAERVICPAPGLQKLRIFVSTLSTKRKKFRLTVGVSDFLLSLDQAKHHITVAKNAPRVLRFYFPINDTEDNFEVKITNSSLAACTIISIQKAEECPQTFLDDENNIRFGSSYQTMLEKSAMIVSKKRYPNGFNLVLLGLRNNSDCYTKNIATSKELGQSSMDVSIEVNRMKKGFISEDIVTESIFVVIGFYLFMAFIYFAVTKILDKCFGFELEGMYGTVEGFLKKKERLARKKITEDALINTVHLALVPKDQVDGQLEPTNGDIQPEPEKTPSWTFPWQSEWQPQNDAEENNDSADRQTEDENSDDVDGGMTMNVDNTRPRVKVAKSAVSGTRSVKDTRQTYRTLDQTCRTLHDHHRQSLRSQLFSWLIVLAGIFYAIPAFQMVFNHQNPFLHGGDQDICYYNFFCIFPYGKLADFGHVFSNIGYVIAGLYFILNVYIRRLKFEKISSKLAYIGIPEQVGIFYALGGALTLEGVLSGIYHICPTSANFQFDTTFMFFIAVLIFLKLYQFRHVDTTLTAQLVFLLIGVVLTLEVVGYFTSHTIFWVCFIITYMVFMLLFILKIYLDEKRFKRVFSIIYSKMTKCSFETKSIRLCDLLRDLLPCISVIVINLVMATFFGISAKPGVSRYLLAILMINMMCYEAYYVLRKMHLRLRPSNWQENEGIRPITLLYLLMSVVFMAGACFFFIKELKTSAGTPAESRNKNDECFLWIFDNHDMWHFLSAAGLYQHLMFLLTLEDYNIGYMKQRRHIAVF